MNRSTVQLQDVFVRWFEDETFYSLCCRQHKFLGNLKTSDTLDWLFSRHYDTMTQDFPHNLGSLTTQAPSAWGDPTSIIREHTILPLFFPFQSDQQIPELAQSSERALIGAIKHRLGLLAGRFGAEHPLKACTACMAEDLVIQGVAFWHLSHQYPGVVLCPIHGLVLRESTVNCQWPGRLQFELPCDDILAPQTVSVPSTAVHEALQRLGKGVLDLASYAMSRCFNPMIVRSVYQNALTRLCINGQDRTLIATSFTEYASLLQTYAPLHTLPAATQDPEAFLKQLTHNPGGHYHPLKHLTLITWLFGRLESFIEAYDRLERLLQHPERPITQLEYLKAVTAAPKSGELFAVKPLNKPENLKPTIRDAALKRLGNGDSADSIVSKIGQPTCNANGLPSSAPTVLKLWAERLQQTALREHRSKWHDTVMAHSGTNAKRIRLEIPGIYAWLYRNDRVWLLAQTRELRCGKSLSVGAPTGVNTNTGERT
ncbi:TnsD family transposase [Pseudomonas sp. B21-040]|uniref:TnsD family transposase n=1 Tax=Pseudomonas sp. B21-040 TaxID=2895486 RepID=UPI00215E7D0C|nr:TnsD family transposase [Pseudomonas sp. B21-040]UVL40425.1 TnsD family transposase [Pseudomonas sp. B21-040]